MAEALVAVTAGSGHNVHFWDRTIAATLVKDQFVIPSEYPYASYAAIGENISAATAASHILQVMAGSSTYVRIRRIRLEQETSAGSAAVSSFIVVRLTTAGTGGTSVTPSKFDNGDSAASATAMTLPSAKGTEGVTVVRFNNVFRSAAATNGGAEDAFEWTQLPNQKPIIIPAGTSNGIAIKNANGIASSTVIATIEFVETGWLGA